MNQNGQLAVINASQWQALATITLSTGMVALLIYYYGLKKTTARVSAICELVWPVSAIFIDFWYFQSSFSVTQMIGVIAVLFGIYKVTMHHRYRHRKYTGIVEHGTKDAGRMGYPTVNLDPSIVPSNIKPGIYAAQVHYNNTVYKGALFYGPRLVKNESYPVLEIHILDFNKQIYDEKIQFEIGKYIRENHNFKTIELLKKQIAEDIEAIRNI